MLFTYSDCCPGSLLPGPTQAILMMYMYINYLFTLIFISSVWSININFYICISGHIQIAQVPDRGEPDKHGEINFPYVFDLLRKLNYDGFVGLEYKPRGECITNEKKLITQLKKVYALIRMAIFCMYSD